MRREFDATFRDEVRRELSLADAFLESSPDAGAASPKEISPARPPWAESLSEALSEAWDLVEAQAEGDAIVLADRQGFVQIFKNLLENSLRRDGPGPRHSEALRGCDGQRDRMNDLVLGARVEWDVEFHGQDLYGPLIDPVEVRRRIGMVFHKPNPSRGRGRRGFQRLLNRDVRTAPVG